MPNNNRNKKSSNQDKTRPYKVPKKTTKKPIKKSGENTTKRVQTVQPNPKVKNTKQQGNKGKKKNGHPKLMMALKIIIIQKRYNI